jgi:ABC-2 type transport system ATP-binding protein
VEVETDGIAGRSDIQQRLEQVSGVSKVLFKNATDHRMTFEVEGLSGQAPRADVARAIVHAGWNLLELRSMNYSLEEVFLQLTGGTASVAAVPVGEQE